MKRASITSLIAVAASLAAGCGGGTRTVVRTRTVTATKAPVHEAAATTPSRSTTSANGGALPAFIAAKWTGTKPSEIDFSGDAGNIVTRIHWSLWTWTTAVGEGTSGIQSCVPNCASPKTKFVPATITLSAPHGGHFTRITETRNVDPFGPHMGPRRGRSPLPEAPARRAQVAAPMLAATNLTPL